MILEQHVLCSYAFSPLSRRKLLFYISTIIFAIIFVFIMRDFICFFALSSVGLKMNSPGLASTSHTLLQIKTEICCIPSLWPRCWTLPTSSRICQTFFAFSSPNLLEVSLCIHFYLYFKKLTSRRMKRKNGTNS